MKVAKTLTIATLAGLTVAAQATILTFNIDGLSNFSAVSDNYGDNVSSADNGAFHYGVGAEGFTPTITAEYGGAPGASPAWWSTGYGDLQNILFEDADGVGVLEITLTAATGMVQLYDFDMAAFTSAFATDPTINQVRVRNGVTNATLFQSNNQIISRTAHTHFDFTAAPLSASTLIISFNTSNLGGLSDDIGFDNIRFGHTAVPEPGTMAALALGVGALIRRRFKKA